MQNYPSFVVFIFAVIQSSCMFYSLLNCLNIMDLNILVSVWEDLWKLEEGYQRKCIIVLLAVKTNLFETKYDKLGISSIIHNDGPEIIMTKEERQTRNLWKILMFSRRWKKGWDRIWVGCWWVRTTTRSISRRRKEKDYNQRK